MGDFWITFLWTAIPVALLLAASVVGAVWFTHRRPRPADGPQDRVARAYRQATTPAGGTSRPAHAASPAGAAGQEVAAGR